MVDQAKAVADNVVSEAKDEHSSPAANGAKEDFKLGIPVLDGTVHKIDAGVKKFSTQIHKVTDAVIKR